MIEVSGSKAEGFDIKGSDADVLVIIDNIGIAYENTTLFTSNENPLRIQYKSFNTKPGYMFVELVIDGKYISIPSSFYMNECIENIIAFQLLFKTQTHGPSLAMSSVGEDIDIVPTLRCDK